MSLLRYVFNMLNEVSNENRTFLRYEKSERYLLSLDSPRDKVPSCGTLIWARNYANPLERNGMTFCSLCVGTSHDVSID